MRVLSVFKGGNNVQINNRGYYATSRKVTASIPDLMIAYFNRPIPSSRTVALGWTQPVAEMTTRNLPCG
jgi:hypothetical protein